MAHIEVFFGVLVFMFSLIGLARGFLRELGVTTVMMFLLFFLSQFETHLDAGLTKAVALGMRSVSVQAQSSPKCWFFILVIIAAAFISYQGETLSFPGQDLRGTQGILLGLITGALNGYLIAGSIWYYMDKFSYPIAWLGFTADGLSKTAATMVELLPISFLGQPVLLGQSMLLYLFALLIIARVIR